MEIRSLPALKHALTGLPRGATPDFDRPFAPREQAGVALLIRRADPIDLLFIKRAANPRDPWSGHMALPGGRREPQDTDLLATARRETLEETGVDLGDSALAGRLPVVAPKGPHLPRIAVVPFLFFVPESTVARPSPDEVERTRWIPLSTLLTPQARDEYRVTLPSGERTFPCIRVESDVIWGMTFRIVEDLSFALQGLRGSRPTPQ